MMFKASKAQTKTRVWLGQSISSVVTARRVMLSFLFFFSFGIAAYSLILPYLGLTGPIHSRLFKLPALFLYMHIIGGAVALILAPFQLLSKKAQRYHKARGYLYVVSVLLSSIGGFYMALEAYGGLVSTVALTLLAFLWLSTTAIGVYFAINKEVHSHQRWMIRSVSLTFAAITLRLISPILYEFFTLYQAQQVIYWSCWTINLLFAEWYIRAHMNL